MRWLEALRRLFTAAVLASIAIPELASPVTPGPPNLDREAPDTAGAVDLSISFRLGLTENPRSQYGPDQRTSLHRAGFVGAQFTVVHEDHFQLGFGLERLTTPYTRNRIDTVYGRIEDFQFNGWLFYLSPGVHSRLGNDQPLGVGANVDLGFLWAEEVVSRDSAAGASGGRIGAIRPKAVITYDLPSSLVLQLEAGWLWAEYTDFAASQDYFDNFFGGTSGGASMYKNFTGPFVASMITLPLPMTPPVDQPSRIRLREATPTVNWGIRLGMLTRSAQTGPRRWDYDGTTGASFARGFQISVMTHRGFELGLGADRLSTSTEDVRDVLSNAKLHAAATFVFATAGYQGITSPVRQFPLGFAVDVGNLWSREVTSIDYTGWSRSYSSGLDGPAARVKLTASPNITRWMSLQIAAGWLFGKLGFELPLTPYPDTQYPSPWTNPSLIDFSGPSLVAMFKLNAPSGKSDK